VHVSTEPVALACLELDNVSGLWGGHVLTSRVQVWWWWWWWWGWGWRSEDQCEAGAAACTVQGLKYDWSFNSTKLTQQ
jgi:hypothetical protein